jgi:hypothetical protein
MIQIQILNADSPELLEAELVGVQEAFAGFIRNQVVDPNGVFHTPTDFDVEFHKNTWPVGEEVPEPVPPTGPTKAWTASKAPRKSDSASKNSQDKSGKGSRGR